MRDRDQLSVIGAQAGRLGAAVAGLVLFGAAPAWATWSIIAVDQRTRAVAIASATCVAQERFAGFPARDLMDIQAIIVPGKAVAAAQAGVDRSRQNQRLIYRALVEGVAPADIIEQLKADPEIESRQFAIVDMEGRSAGFSGAKNGASSLDRQDQVPGTGIYFSVQGNILAGEDVVTAAVEAMRSSEGTLADRVMAAMEAADQRGGDRRCTCETEPRTAGVPCDGKTSQVAYILMAEESNTIGDSYNDGRYTLYVSATNADILPHENANPVRTLRARYEEWKRTSGWNPDEERPSMIDE